MEIKKVAVIGAGLMGNQIAILCAINGYNTVCYSRSEKTVEKAKAFAVNWFEKAVKKEKMTQQDVDKVQEQLAFTSDIKAASENAQLVVEAVADETETKIAVLREVDKYVSEEAIYASNSSYIVSSEFCNAVRRPENMLNLHFFNPALVMKVVEVVQGKHTAQATVDTVFEFAKSIGKTPVLVRKEIYGFIVNRIFSALTREACYLVDMGVASAEDIDTAVKGGLGHPMGPLELLDMTGIDLEYTVYMEKFRKSGDLADRPSAALAEHFHKGEYGRKSGKGFYKYD